MKDKKGETVLNAFIKIVDESNHKRNKLWVDQERSLQWLDNNNILMYSIHTEVKSVLVERFIKTLNAKI